MSVIVTATYEGETFEVEVFHDGSLEFPGRDLEHDQVVAALGGKLSTILRFEDNWTKDSISVVCAHMSLSKSSRFLLAADFAEHVLYIFEDRYQDDKRPRLAIDAVRNFIANKINTSTLKDYKKSAAKAWDEADMARDEPCDEVRDTAWAARMAAWTTVDAVSAQAYGAAWGAARAAAYSISLNRHSIEWQQAHGTEVAWQIRRFVDCMEAVGQGLDWPDLGATP